MTKFHINKKGEVTPCNAQKKPCPLNSEHFSDAASAENFLNNKHGSHKIRKKSNIKTTRVYHGSPKKFEEFDYSEIGVNGTSEGQGFYFTDSKEVAGYYGENGYLYEVDFHGEKPLSITERTISKGQFREILEALHSDGSEYLSDWGDLEYEGYDAVLDRAVDGSYYDGPGSNDVDNIGGIINASEGSAKVVYRKIYEDYGYDHIPAKPDWGTKGQTVFVATVPEAFTVRSISKNSIE